MATSELTRRYLVVALAVLAVASDCSCDEHVLYNEGANRFDSWYLGGGNSQFRPFRSAAYDAGARFDVELRVREFDEDDPGDVVVAARIGGERGPDVEGEVIARFADASPAREEVLASFDHVDDDLSLARIDRARLAQLASHDATLVLRFSDGSAAAASLELRPQELLAPASGEQAPRELP